MLNNNAIEHSKSDRIKIELYRDGGDLIFTIRDFGVGGFEDVKKKYKLDADLDAIQEFLKGKTTTVRLILAKASFSLQRVQMNTCLKVSVRD